MEVECQVELCFWLACVALCEGQFIAVNVKGGLHTDVTRRPIEMVC